LLISFVYIGVGCIFFNLFLLVVIYLWGIICDFVFILFFSYSLEVIVMAYVAPTIRSAGDAVTAADYNIMANNALQFAPFVQGVFTNEAARDAAITSPTEGMHAYLTAATVPAGTGSTSTQVPSGVRTIYNGSVWVCVTPVGARANVSGTTTSASYVNTLTSDGTSVSVTLVTGTTALVQFHSTGVGSIPSTPFLTFAVSGATTLAAADEQADRDVVEQIGRQVGLNRSLIQDGLTAGTNTFTLNYRTDGGTMEFLRRNLIVQGIA
jgi:hypothetical protein